VDLLRAHIYMYLFDSSMPVIYALFSAAHSIILDAESRELQIVSNSQPPEAIFLSCTSRDIHESLIKFEPLPRFQNPAAASHVASHNFLMTVDVGRRHSISLRNCAAKQSHSRQVCGFESWHLSSQVPTLLPRVMLRALTNSVVFR
jgi:hypothetical protein